MNERIKEVRKTVGLTQTEFANRIGLSQNFITQLETGSKNPSDRTLSDICREFSVSEQWLRTGKGEMFVPVEDETAAVVASLLDESNPMFDLVLHAVRIYEKLDDKSRAVIDCFIEKLLQNQK